jgi:threonine aldolase
MRAFMAEAPVGDEQRGEDPAVSALQREMSEALGHEAGLYLPSATMANQIAVRLHTRQGEEALGHELCHMANWEAGGMAALSGVQPRLLAGAQGKFTAATLAAAIRGDKLHNPRSALVCIENTSNLGGGAWWRVEEIEAVAAVAREKGLELHCDGSRFFNAAVALAAKEGGVENPPLDAIHSAARQLARPFQSVTVCCSKGLGAPVGAVLVGSGEFIQRARRLKHQFGGAMRQAGIIAAGALYGLRHNVLGLARDHALARRLANGLATIPGLKLDPREAETNIVMPEVLAPLEAARVAEELRQQGVGSAAYGAQGPRFRFVTHLGISEEMTGIAIERTRAIMETLRKQVR